MKLSDIIVGGRYVAKVSGMLTTVRVLGIREIPPPWHGAGTDRWRKRIDVVNERTGRKTSFASAAKLRRAAGPATAPAPAAEPDRCPACGAEYTGQPVLDPDGRRVCGGCGAAHPPAGKEG